VSASSSAIAEGTSPSPGWYRVMASPVAHAFLDGIAEGSRAKCGVICTRKAPWKHIAKAGGLPCPACQQRGAP
jgi:hypothetical protein